MLRNAYESNGLIAGADKVAGEGVWRSWTMQGEGGGEGNGFFVAMLGTDNVRGVVWLLGDHAVEMGRKEVVGIWTRWEGVHPDVWYVDCFFFFSSVALLGRIWGVERGRGGKREG